VIDVAKGLNPGASSKLVKSLLDRHESPPFLNIMTSQNSDPVIKASSNCGQIFGMRNHLILQENNENERN
jgi:hypothetical protein